MNRRPVQPLVDERADVLVCGASFAGLVVARELAGTGADVLVLDRDEIGAHPTSACAAPMPWLEALGLEGSVRQEIPFMRFTTPRDSIRVRLPWSWGAFDYAELCRLLWNQSGARFERALVKGRVDGGVRTDRGIVRAPLVVDALGWRRVLGSQPLAGTGGTLSRGLEVHPSGSGDALDVVIDRSLVRRGYCWHVPAGDEVRVGAASYDPRVGVKQSTADVARRFGVPPVRHQGNLIPHRLRPAAENGCFFVGDSAGHCFAFSAEGIRGAFYFGIACGRELRRVLAREATVDEALAAYGTFSAKHRRGFWITYALQRLVPELPPRALTMVIRALSRRRLVEAIFNWYLGLLPLTLAERAGVDRASPARGGSGSARSPDRAEQQAEHERRQDRQEPIEEHRGDHRRVVPPKPTRIPVRTTSTIPIPPAEAAFTPAAPSAQFVMVTGTPGPMLSTNQRIVALARRTQPWETALPSTPPTFLSPCSPIWPGPPANSCNTLERALNASANARRRRWLAAGSLGLRWFRQPAAGNVVVRHVGGRLKRLWWVALVAMLGVVLLSSLGRAADAPGRASPLRVLFIGNSQTSTNDLPAFVAEIARASKQPKIEYRTIAPSAITLEGNWNRGSARESLLGGHWDAVVMQQGPSVLPESRAKLCFYAKAFADEAREWGVRPFLLMVWPRRGSGLPEVVDAYSAAAAGADAGLLPGGTAWGAALRRSPDLALYRWDGIHPGRVGTYLAALVVYAGLRGTSPVAPNSLVVSGNPFWIDRETARLLRDSAKEALATRFPAPACSHL